MKFLDEKNPLNNLAWLAEWVEKKCDLVARQISFAFSSLMSSMMFLNVLGLSLAMVYATNFWVVSLSSLVDLSGDSIISNMPPSWNSFFFFFSSSSTSCSFHHLGVLFILGGPWLPMIWSWWSPLLVLVVVGTGCSKGLAFPLSNAYLALTMRKFRIEKSNTRRSWETV